MAKKKPEIAKHVLVPKHTKLSEKQAKEVLVQYNVTVAELPQIRKKDPAIKKLGCKAGDIIEIERKSQTAGKALFYRVVVNA